MDLNYVRVGFEDHLFAALQSEAERLGLTADQVVYRATAAWICEMAENPDVLAAARDAMAVVRVQADA